MCLCVGDSCSTMISKAMASKPRHPPLHSSGHSLFRLLFQLFTHMVTLSAIHPYGHSFGHSLLRGSRYIVLHNVGDVGEVQTAGRNIGTEQYCRLGLRHCKCEDKVWIMHRRGP